MGHRHLLRLEPDPDVSNGRSGCPWGDLGCQLIKLQLVDSEASPSDNPLKQNIQKLRVGWDASGMGGPEDGRRFVKGGGAFHCVQLVAVEGKQDGELRPGARLTGGGGHGGREARGCLKRRRRTEEDPCPGDKELAVVDFPGQALNALLTAFNDP